MLIETSDSKFTDRSSVKGTWKTTIYKTNSSIMQGNDNNGMETFILTFKREGYIQNMQKIHY